MEDCKIARQVAGWNRRRDRAVNIWKDGTRDSMQRRNLKDEEFFDHELWKENYVFGLRKTVYPQKDSYI
jgi:hypothetical protein